MKTFTNKDGREWPAVYPNQSGPSPRQWLALAARQLGCANCIYWDGDPGEPVGRCRRNAPTLVSYARQVEVPAGEETDPVGHQVGVFPITDEDDWCGKFQAAPRDRGGTEPTS